MSILTLVLSILLIISSINGLRYIGENHKLKNEPYVGEIVIDVEEDGEPTMYFVASTDVESILKRRWGRVGIIKCHTKIGD